MSPAACDPDMHTNLEDLASAIYQYIADNFPIVAASDEFYYFPQVQSKPPDWRVWDRFSPEGVSEFCAKLSLGENDLENILQETGPTEIVHLARIKILKKVLGTLKEHLLSIRTWETQPSLYLTITCLGLAEAFEHGSVQADQRAQTLPWFLDQARKNLTNVPSSYLEVGLKMIPDTRAYLLLLQRHLPGLDRALEALDRFENHLKSVSAPSQFRLSADELTRVIEKHLNCQMSIPEAEEVLDLEIEAMTRVLARQAQRMGCGSWQEAYHSLPLPRLGNDGLVGLYREEVLGLGQSCRDLGLVGEGVYQANPVQVMPVPEYLSAIRAASSYSIPPGHPPAGGVFYVINAQDPQEMHRASLREFRVLAAHETWPGHHLLDIYRWNLPSPLLRAVEQPVFYEGWACFAEEMLAKIGCISEPGGRLLLAKRRLWRAIRGKVDLGLQTGGMDLDRALSLLSKAGMTREQAQSSALKYKLSPGYQVCYTLGLRRFLDLYERYGTLDLAGFARVVLNHGQICFDDLERILTKHSTGMVTSSSF